MKFLVIDQTATIEVVSDRFLQSIEFEAGKALAALLTRAIRTANLNTKVVVAEHSGGVCILGETQISQNLLVIDEASARLFEGRRDDEALTIFQKLCRFAVRYWQNARPSRSETVLSNTTKAVIFPFPISNQTAFRIVVEREPDSKRLSKRSDGNFLLAYRGGTDEGGGRTEEAPLTEFRRAVEAVEAIRKERAAAPKKEAVREIGAMGVTALTEPPDSPLPPQMGFDRWLTLLTEKQKQFVQTPLTVPHRIEGAAGTGKTLCLMLKCLNGVRQAELVGNEHHALFVAHSSATRRTIQELFDSNDVDAFSKRDMLLQKQSIKVTTLHELCGELLNTRIFDTEFLDRDALESKNTQLLYILESLEDAMRNDFTTFKRFLSNEFSEFLENNEQWIIAEMIQLEISVIIKGRADEDLNKYKSLEKIKYGLPVVSESDRGFVFKIFQGYQNKLRVSAQFDTDDIVLTATGQLNTPIWRRRRVREAYDAIYIDETHLFNMNELSLFHHLTRSESSFPIAYSVDKSQSIGDRGWGDLSSRGFFVSPEGGCGSETIVRSVFRCAPEIINFAFSITSSGATLFTNFENPLSLTFSAFVEGEEMRSKTPNYIEFSNDDTLIEGAFFEAEAMLRDLRCLRHQILIVAFDPTLIEYLKRYGLAHNKPIEAITQRGDIDVIRRAQRAGRFVVGQADYVGGLEFEGSILVGVDDGRVPPTRDHQTSESSNFLSYAAHSRLYVAITRAKYRVSVLGTSERGASRLLAPAFGSRALIRE